ncbi:hypothetical protein DFJ74DRAFT_650173 [Hyaloraphidium curvatum]|nr:hypothetical protein DFJ74DRAFT_650173 [Hyaloraphidium curvatum]
MRQHGHADEDEETRRELWRPFDPLEVAKTAAEHVLAHFAPEWKRHVAVHSDPGAAQISFPKADHVPSHAHSAKLAAPHCVTGEQADCLGVEAKLIEALAFGCFHHAEGGKPDNPRTLAAPFFATLKCPMVDPPDDIAAGFLAIVFVRLYPFLRSCVAASVDPVRRRAWGAWVPGDPPARRSAFANLLYDAVFSFPASVAIRILRALAESRPVRRRIAEDPALLEGVASYAACHPWLSSMRYAVALRDASVGRVGSPKRAERFREVRHAAGRARETIEPALELLEIACAANPRPWQDRIAARGAFEIEAALDELREVIALRPDASPGPGADSEVAEEWDAHGRRIAFVVRRLGLESGVFAGNGAGSSSTAAAPSAASSDADADELDGIFSRLRITGIIPDSCDDCAEESGDGTLLKRCGRCKSARYCSLACQKRAWLAHKADCFDAGELKDGYAAGEVVKGGWRVRVKDLVHSGFKCN